MSYGRDDHGGYGRRERPPETGGQHGWDDGRYDYPPDRRYGEPEAGPDAGYGYPPPRGDRSFTRPSYQHSDFRRSGGPPEPPPRKNGLSRNAKIGLGVVGALFLLGIGAVIGGGGGSSTATTTTAAAVPVAGSVAPGVAPTAGESAAAAVAPVATVPPGTPAPSKAVPNVVGMNHQSAQDALQAAGFYNLAEEDATGQGRLLVWDRNWQVVAQVPASGSVISTDDQVLLRSKKITDP